MAEPIIAPIGHFFQGQSLPFFCHSGSPHAPDNFLDTRVGHGAYHYLHGGSH